MENNDIKKALECCVKAETHLDCRKLKCPAIINDECIYIGETEADCNRQQFADVLALITSQEQRIRELGEEVESLGAEKEHLDLVVEGKLKRTTALEKQVRKLTEENESLTTRLVEQSAENVILIGENKRLRNELTATIILTAKDAERIKTECLEKIELDVKAIKADTVRKMHSMLCEGRVSNDTVVIVANQIAKEMLEEE